MNQEYSLPCSCGNSIAVELRKAGGSVRCIQCGANVEVPKLRDLRKLDPIAKKGPTRTRRGWSGLQGTLFALGLLAMAIAAGSAFYTYQHMSFYDEFTNPAELDFDTENVKNASLLDSWQMWNELKKVELESRPIPRHVYARQRVAAMNKWMFFFAVVAAIGLASMVLSFLVPSSADA